jgi:hypothetical protein
VKARGNEADKTDPAVALWEALVEEAWRDLDASGL